MSSRHGNVNKNGPPVDNDVESQFVPRLAYKPHARRPLSISPEHSKDGKMQGYTHPYQFELDNFKPTQSQLARGELIEPGNLNSTPLVYVDTKHELREVIDELSSATEIAVDVEQNGYRSYQGITCLLQISTRQKDYIIDTLALWKELHILNEIFAKPDVLKVFHDGRNDILWLQRDLSIYVVNMFDTFKAARLLSEGFSLASLLQRYCGIEADKTSATDDWRIRPLPERMIAYARQDTHYLLFIYDQLRQKLLNQDQGLLQLLIVYQHSTEVCKRRYAKIVLQPDSHLKMYQTQKTAKDSFGYRQLVVLRELYAWRDRVARREDEGIGYVLPNRIIMEIARKMPSKKRDIENCCGTLQRLVQDPVRINELHLVVSKVCEESLLSIILADISGIIKRSSTTTSSTSIIVSRLRKKAFWLIPIFLLVQVLAFALLYQPKKNAKLGENLV